MKRYRYLPTYRYYNVEGCPLTLEKSIGKDIRDYKIYGNSVKLLHVDYQQVEYIESTGEQYLDTGLKLNQNSKLELLISHFDTNGNRRTFGSRASATADNFSVVSGPVSGTMSIVTDFHNYQNNRLAYVINGDEFLDIAISNKKLKINDLEKEISTYSDFETPYNAYLFNCSGSYPTGYTNAKMRLYSCKIYDNEMLVRNFIPCYRKSDNVIGLYDLVNDVFYTNIGTGTFLKGNDVPTPEAPIELEGLGDKTRNLWNKETHPFLVGNYQNSNNQINTYQKYVITTTWQKYKAGTYTISGNVNSFATYISKQTSDTTSTTTYLSYQPSSTFTLDKDEIITIQFNCNLDGLTADKFIDLYSSTFQVEEGTTATEYEPYGYKIPVKVSNDMEEIITNIYLNEPLRKIGDYADYIDFKNQKIVREVEVLDGSLKGLDTPIEETIELPNIPTIKGTTIIEVDTTTKPSNMIGQYYR